MMGFAGQLSLGHALYVGLGAYATAALYIHFGIGPWLGMSGRDRDLAVACGAVIGFLAFRFGVAGVYFAHPDHRLRRVRPHRLRPFQLGRRLRPASSCRSPTIPATICWNLRGRPAMFYYVMLALTRWRRSCCATACCSSRIGYYWQAIREDEEAARALGIDTFRYKMIAVVISAGMTAIAGVFYAFYYNNLFPEQVFHIARSIELILGPIIGGIGTLFGPIIGAFLLTGLAELHARAAERVRPRRRPAPSRCSTASACWWW